MKKYPLAETINYRGVSYSTLVRTPYVDESGPTALILAADSNNPSEDHVITTNIERLSAIGILAINSEEEPDLIEKLLAMGVLRRQVGSVPYGYNTYNVFELGFDFLPE